MQMPQPVDAFCLAVSLTGSIAFLARCAMHRGLCTEDFVLCLVFLYFTVTSALRLA
jgi:hypothetical protein